MKSNEKTRGDFGFSLVELVVVVLIMAIIAVALAPNVMKWVKNSKNASDVQTKNELVRLCSLALADNDAFKIVRDGGYTITMTKASENGGVVYTYTEEDGLGNVTPNPNNLYWKKLLEICNCGDFSEFESSMTIKSDPAGGEPIAIKVEIYNDGHTMGYVSGIENEDIDIS